MSKLDELKALNANAKEINEQRKALREELDANKENRKEARKTQAQCRKDVIGGKKSLRDLSAKIYDIFSGGDAEEINGLADEIMEAGTALSATVRAFAEAQEKFDGETSEETEEDEAEEL